MVKKAIALGLAMLLLQASGAGASVAALAQEEQRPEQTKAEVAKAHAKQYNVQVTTADGKKLKGKVNEFTNESFVLRDESGTETSFAYSQVRVNRHRHMGTKILVGVGLGAAAAGILFFCYASKGCSGS